MKVNLPPPKEYGKIGQSPKPMIFPGKPTTVLSQDSPQIFNRGECETPSDESNAATESGEAAGLP